MTAMPGVKRIEFNAIYEPVFTTKKRYVILCGGSNAGKSYFGQQLILSRFLSVPKYNVLAIRKVYDSVGGSIFHLFQKLIMQWEIGNKVHETKYMIENLINGNLIQFGGLNDDKQRERTKSITAPNGNIECILCEEATQLTIDDYRELDRRMRGESDTGLPKQMFFFFNPVIETHWIRKEFQLELSMEGAITRRDDVFVLRTTIEDNKWATEEDWEVLNRYEKDGEIYSYNVYRYGLWGAIDQDNVIIPYSLFYKARDNHIDNPEGKFKVGCDPARFGKNKTVIYYGRGNKVMQKKEFQKSDNFMIADAICDMDDYYRKDKAIPLDIKVDAGEGGGVVDILNRRRLPNTSVFELHNNGSAKDAAKYENLAAESWFELRDNIECIEFIPNDEEMKSQCTGRQYMYKELKGRTGLGKTVKAIEPKEHYRERYEELHGQSPDSADAIVLWNYEPARYSPGIRFLNV